MPGEVADCDFGSIVARFDAGHVGTVHFGGVGVPDHVLRVCG